jgi:predicted nucleic-acid-binding protein
MIGIDTNVLVRAVIGDDAQQAAHATRFLRARGEVDPAFINPVVAAEFVWVLRAVYRMPRHVIADILRSMIESAAYAFGEREAVLRAFHDYESGVGDFTDRLIAEINDANGCTATVTFDTEAAKIPPFAPMPTR